jgi:hypothetical protein
MIDEANLAKQLLEVTPVGSTVSDVWGLILGDRIAYFRRKNAMKLSKLLHIEAERLGGKLDPSRIPDPASRINLHMSGQSPLQKSLMTLFKQCSQSC